jgi:outer membrane lipoprotein-sorting protein
MIHYWRQIIAVLCVVGTQFLVSQQMTAEKILHKVKANFDAVQDYSAQLTAKVNMERLHIPEMNVTIYFKQPNKVHIESKNFAMLPREGFALNPSDLLTKFDATLMGTEERNSVQQYKLRLISKPERGRPPRESFIWIDPANWVITHLESTPAEGRKVSVDFEYTTVEGKYTLPALLKASFDFEQNPDSLAERIYSPNRIPRKGSVEILYSQYKVNQGLSDEIFKKKQEPEKK